jgi:hypothetical protein
MIGFEVINASMMLLGDRLKVVKVPDLAHLDMTLGTLR